jgi:hypothetical protein
MISQPIGQRKDGGAQALGVLLGAGQPELIFGDSWQKRVDACVRFGFGMNDGVNVNTTDATTV